MVALLAAFVTCCGAEKPGPALTPQGAEVTRPGRVLFPRDERAAELARLPPALGAAWCPAHVGPAPQPVARLRALPDGPDNASEPFALAVMTDAGAALAGDSAATARLIRLLARWADAGALRGGGGERGGANRAYALDRTLLPTIVAFASVAGNPGMDAVTRERVRSWLGHLVETRPRPGAGDLTRRNNHHYLRGSVDAAWGALVGDDERFQAGVAAYLDALRSMRPDGSLPLETRRGARALWYQRHAIASLVVTAEVAANQGLDLYGRRVDGRDLHAAISFLLDAVEDPARVQPYATADDNPGLDQPPNVQDLSFLATRGHGRHYMAWVEIYAARFPGRPESRRLMGLLARSDPGFRPMLDDYSGGATTCYFARPS
jgi:poly(beta-D-mannuronate) lyase